MLPANNQKKILFIFTRENVKRMLFFEIEENSLISSDAVIKYKLEEISF
jgi:hypothetical protein